MFLYCISDGVDRCKFDPHRRLRGLQTGNTLVHSVAVDPQRRAYTAS